MRFPKYPKVRDYFENLRWNDHNDLHSYNVFTKKEINASPLKWLKYILLARVGLSSMAELEKTIQRFDKNEIHSLAHQLELLFSNRNNKELMAVTKIIYIDKAGQLPNYRVYSKEDITNAINFVEQRLNEAHEIWICVSTVGENESNFGGRITFPLSNKLEPSLLEIVWFTSPRKIQDFTVENFQYPFISAYKSPISLSYRPNIFYIPTKHNTKTLSEVMLSDTQLLLRKVYRKREEIEILMMILKNAGAKELSLEFKSSFGVISFIDWDTEIETSVE